MILARNSITLHHLRDITTVVWYYKLQASTASPPAKPTTATPSGWSTTEPSYTEGSTNSLYVVQKTTFSDGTFEYSDVSLSTSYEAAKAAYNKSVQAQTTANAAQESIDNLEIGGRNLLSKANVLSQTTAYTEENYIYTGLYGYGGGLKLPASLFEVGEKYVLSFKFKKISGTLTAIGGHCSGFSSYGNRFVVDGVKEESRNYSQGHLMSDDSDVHAVEVYLMFNGDASDNNLYIQPNRGAYTQANDNKFQIWDLQLEKGNRKTDWTPAPEDLQADIDTLQPELIVGTHGTTATATWTGTSTVLTELKAGTRIQYKLSSAGASNVTLNLTLKNGTTTGAKAVYFVGNTRLGTQYDINAVVDLIYDGSAWRVLNPYYNSNTVGTYGGTVTAGANGVKNYSLVMRDTGTTWVSLTTTAGTGATKSRYTGKLYPDKVMYMGSNAAYASGATTGTCYEALGVNLQYSTNCASTLTSGRPVYLVGTLDSDGMFTLDATWWTQTIPASEDGKTYIYLGLAYSTTNIYLVPDNPMYQYYEGAFRTLREIEEMEAAKTATNYLAMDNTGIMVADMSGGTQYTPSNVPAGVKNAFIDNDSFNVRDGQDVVASFGETSQIGKDEANHQIIDSSGIQGVTMFGDVVFDVQMNSATVHIPKYQQFLNGGEYFYKELTTTTLSTPVVRYHKIKGRAVTGTPIVLDWSWSIIDIASDDVVATGSKTISFVYGQSSEGEKSDDVVYRDKEYAHVTLDYDGTSTFTLNGFLQNLAVTSGYYIEIICYGFYCTCEFHEPAFTFGTRRSTTFGSFSCVVGEGLSAASHCQFVCGQFNEENDDCVFIVGNGENGYSNAYAITWDGDQLFALDTTASSGTTDADLYDAITALGWEDDVIV